MSEDKKEFKIKLGWKPSKVDSRDLKYNIPFQKINLPSFFQFIPHIPA